VEKATGVGGVFLRSDRPEALRAWYAEHLGIDVLPYGGATFRAEPGDVTVWFVAPRDDPYFGEPQQPVMVNYRVRDLEAMLAQLRAAGAPVEERVGDSEHGRFGWVTDPDGNRIELWQPPPGRYPDG